MKTPVPWRPKACISAPSSNSATTRGCRPWRVSQASNCGRADDVAPGTSIGAPFKHCGNGPLRLLASAGAAKKLIVELPSLWLKAFTLRRLVSGSSAITRSMRCSASCAIRSLKRPSVQIRRTGSFSASAGSSSR